NARSPRLPVAVVKGASGARRGLLGEPHGAQNLLHGRLGHFVLDALGAEQVPGDEVARAVLEREGDRLALAVALALLRGAVGVGGGEAALDARGGGVRLRLDRLHALLVGLRVAAVDPPRHAGLGRLVGRLGAVLTAGARRDKGGVLLAAVLVVVGGAPLGLEVGGGGDRGAVHLAVLVLPLEADAGAGRLDLPVGGHVELRAEARVHDDLPAGNGRLLRLAAARLVLGRRGARFVRGAGGRARRRLAVLAALRGVVLVAAEHQESGHPGGDHDGRRRDDRHQLGPVPVPALRGVGAARHGRRVPLRLLLRVRVRLLVAGLLVGIRLLVPRLLVRVVVLRVLLAPGRLLSWPHGQPP